MSQHSCLSPLSATLTSATELAKEWLSCPRHPLTMARSKSPTAYSSNCCLLLNSYFNYFSITLITCSVVLIISIVKRQVNVFNCDCSIMVLQATSANRTLDNCRIIISNDLHAAVIDNYWIRIGTTVTVIGRLPIMIILPCSWLPKRADPKIVRL